MKTKQIVAPQKKKNVAIRVAKPEDREGVRVLLRKLHEKTVFGHMPFSDKKFDDRFDGILARPGHVAGLVAEYNQRIIGCIWATVGQHMISEEGLIATCHVIAVETEFPDSAEKNNGIGHLTRRATTFLRLLKAIKTWSKTRGAESVMVHVTTGSVEGGIQSRSAQRLLRKVSGREIGGAFIV